jgi:hypothetical protein
VVERWDVWCDLCDFVRQYGDAHDARVIASLHRRQHGAE